MSGAVSNPQGRMQPRDARLLGEVIFDPQEQTRLCRAANPGGLPFMWRHKARVVREMMYDRPALRSGKRCSISPC